MYLYSDLLIIATIYVCLREITDPLLVDAFYYNGKETNDFHIK